MPVGYAAVAAELPDDPARPEAFVFRFNPGHRWYYFPDMTRDELLLFKLYDSRRIGAWRTPTPPSPIRLSLGAYRGRASRSARWLISPDPA